MSRRSSRKALRNKNRVVLNVETLESRALPSSTTISGFVYYDANNNGVFDPGETPIANSQIKLINNTTNQVAGTTTTAADGSYSFTTDTTVQGPEQNTATQTITLGPTLTNFQDQGALPQFDPSLGTLDQVVITESGTILSNIQAENTSPVADTIQGTVSGNFSLSAPGVSNDILTVTGQTNSFSAAANPSADHSFTGPSSVTWNNVSATSGTPNTITITDPTALNAYIGTGTVAVTDSANATSNATDTTGNITTNIVSSGEATLTVTYYYHSAGSIQSNDTYTVEQVNVPPTYIPGLNSKNGVVLPYNPTPPEYISNIVVTPQNPIAPNNNFGELKTTSIAGIAYLQTTQNETYLQGTTPPLGGVTMTLTGGNLLTPLTTTTAQDGTYSFTGLQPGNYTVTQTQPAAYQPGTITAGTDGGTVGTETISQVNLNAGDNATGYNFGELNQPSISGFVYYEPNAPTQTLYQNNAATPGIAGVTVTLTGSDGSSHTTTTGQDGSYSFNQLTSGVTYSVAINHPSGYLVGTDTAGSAGGTVSTTNEKISAVTLTGGVMATGYNFGEIMASSLAGNVYVDAQNDGQLDPGDPPIANDTITLTGFNDQGPVSKTTTTAADGSYSFANLRPGTYGITQTQPSGYIPGATTVGSQGGTETTGDISNISLASGVNGVNNNFGELRPSTPGVPRPKNVLPFGILPGISKAQMTSSPSWANIDPALIRQMSQVVATTMTLTGQQLDLNGVAAGVQTLNASGVGGYISQVWNSNAHFAAEVNSAYQTAFNRAPTAAELSAGISQLRTGASSTALLESLYTSQEFQNIYPTSAALVSALYQSILNTTPGTAASSSLVQSLATEPLSTVVQDLMTSTAALENQIDNAYLLVLRRNPTANESGYWLPQLQSGALTIDQLTQQLLSSQEFSALAYANVT
jgi:SdrD B-like domain/Domain of unknown function (DUF4214)